MQSRTERPSSLRWALGLALVLAFAFWLHWPGGAEFKGDDWPTIRYASDAANVAHDFAGSQYDLEFFRFFRPLITLSLGIDYRLYGVEPFGYFLENTLAILVAALLVALLARALVPGGRGRALGLCLALLWLSHPVLVPSARWVVGRVDTHLAPPLLFALLLHLRARHGGARWPVWLAACVAILTKETGLAFPILALGIDLSDPRESSRRAPALFARKLCALPYLVLIPCALGLRKLLLGRFLGGYAIADIASLDPIEPFVGLCITYGRSLVPGPHDPSLVGVLGGIVIVSALAVVLRCRGWPRLVAGQCCFLAGFYGPLVPLIASFGAEGDDRHAFLLCTLPLAHWCLIAFTLGKRRLGIGLALLPLVIIGFARGTAAEAFDAHERFNASVHAAIADVDRRLPAGEPVVLAGEPKLAILEYRFLWGLGSLRKPPFTAREREVVNLHPLGRSARAVPSSWILDAWPAHVRVGVEGGRVEAGRASAPRRAEPVGFDGFVDSDLARRLGGDLDTKVGYRVGPGYEGQVALLTSVGSILLDVEAEGDLLPLAQVFLANAGNAAKGEAMPAMDIAWNAIDLAKDSPIFLLWREGGELREARVRFSRDFVRTYIGLRFGI